MADASKLLRGLLVKAYKMADGEIDALLDAKTTDAEGETLVVDKDKTRIAELTKPKAGQTFQDGYKKAKAEVLTELEGQIKEKYEIESDATGLELVETVVAEKAKTGKPKDLTDDDVRKHPAYQAAEKAHKNALKEANTTWEAKLNEQQTQFKKGEAFSAVSKKALDILGTMNPVLPANATVAANLQSAFLNVLKGYDYDLQDNGNRIVVMKEGKVVDDGHGHSLEFEKLVKDSAGGYFEFKANNGGGNAGNGKPGEGGNGGGGGNNNPAYPAGITKPKTWDEVTKIANDTSLPAKDRETVLKVWEDEQKAGTTV